MKSIETIHFSSQIVNIFYWMLWFSKIDCCWTVKWTLAGDL